MFSDFGQAFKALRTQYGVSMRALALAADMDPAYLSRLENGKTGAPRQETVEKLAQALCDRAQLEAEACDRLRRQLLVSAGLLPGREELIDDLEDRFAARLRQEGFPEDQIDTALARVPLAIMRKVLLGEEQLEIGMVADYDEDEITARRDGGETVLLFDAGSSAPGASPAGVKAGSGHSARDYLERHAQEFAARRRQRRAEQTSQNIVIRAGRDASIQVHRPISSRQEQQLRLLAKLIGSILDPE